MLTVVLTSFNYSRYLAQSIGALLNQSRPADEIIIIDDVSTDNSVDLIQTLISGHPEARLVRNTTNVGCVTNMNRGLAMARGDYIIFAAADDELLPDFFKESMELLDRNPKAALCSTTSYIMDAEGRRSPPLPAPIPLSHPGYIAPERAASLLMRDDGWFMGNATVFRRATLLEEGGFRPELASYADGYLSRLLTLKHGACYHPAPLAVWRRTEHGMAWSQSMAPDSGKESILSVARLMEQDPTFPRGYAERWRRRAQFSNYRFALGIWARQRRTQSPLGRFARLTAFARVLMAFAIYRWFDAIPVVMRHLGYARRSCGAR